MLLGEQGGEQHQDGNTDPERFEFRQPLGPEDRDDQGGIGVPTGQGIVGLVVSIHPDNQLAEEVLGSDFRPDYVSRINDVNQVADNDRYPQAEREMPPAEVVHFQRAPGQGRYPPGDTQQIRDSPDRPERDQGVDWQIGCDASADSLVDREIKQQEGEQYCQAWPVVCLFAYQAGIFLEEDLSILCIISFEERQVG